MQQLVALVRGLGALALAILVLVLAIVLRAQTTAAAPNCGSPLSGAIVESSTFTPYDHQLSHLPDQLLNPGGTVFHASSPSGVPSSLDGMSLTWLVQSPAGSYAYFSQQSVDRTSTASSFVSSGGLQFDVEPRNGSESFAEWLLPHEGERAVQIAIGSHVGAVTWSDPDERGSRPHNVFWADDVNNYTLTGIRTPEALVALARSISCHT